jgi:beta-galactosidase
MPQLSRRSLLASGLAVGTPLLSLPLDPVAAQSAREQDGRSVQLPAAIAPREELLLDFGWRFALGHASDPAHDFGFGMGQSDFSKTGDFKIAKSGFDDTGWRMIDLPHDWAVELPFVNDDQGQGDANSRSHGFKPLGRRYPETSVGWYRRTFDIPASDKGRRIWIEFDGALRDAVVWVNGCFVGRNDNGYMPFRFDLSDVLNYGGANHVVVRVDASFGDGWFYEGAGIYRHVWLTKMDPVHLGKWDSVVRPTVEQEGATLDLATVVQNDGDRPASVTVDWTILDASGRTVARATSGPATVTPAGSAECRTSARVTAPQLWSVETPNLYTAIVKVAGDGAVHDGERVTFGIRTLRFDADKGFFLNGVPTKIQGTCNHHDHAGVGAALPDALQRFRLTVLQGMGCNAVRTSHNQPTPEWVESCDRMGVMMMCETRQMSSSEEGLRQLELMVKRFRNSPSIIMWSIGNEEWQLQKGDLAPQGARIARTMVELCHRLDPTRVVSAAVNGDNQQGVSDPLDIIGFNYNVPYFPEAFHKKHPTRPIFGSETSSAVSTRGEYANDPARNVVSSYDGVVPWGQTPEQWWKFYGSHEWATGGFAWTGFDYRGEPTPYGWPSVNSQFGIVDMCGFPKDYYYYYKAWWGKAPSLHLFPHWDWPDRIGEEIPVWVYSNLDEVELSVNGRSLGWQKVPQFGHVEWKVRYQPGVIEARGRRGGRIVLTERRETTGPARSIRLSADRRTIDADGQDVAMVTVEVLDARGRHIPTAQHKIAFSVSGPGRIIGVGNGDPNSHESDKEPSRSLFNGFAQVIVQSTRHGGKILLEAVPEGRQLAPPLGTAIAIESRRPLTLRPTV